MIAINQTYRIFLTLVPIFITDEEPLTFKSLVTVTVSPVLPT